MSKNKNTYLFITLGVICLTLVSLSFEKMEKIQVYKCTENTQIKKMGDALAIFESYKLPERLSFAGEDVPIGRKDVRNKLEKQISINNFSKLKMKFVIKRKEYWFPKFKDILTKYGIPEDLLYIAVAESGLNNVESPVNARGHWQIMKSTAQELGLIVNTEIDERYHPLKSAEAACKYLKNAYEKLGTWTLATAAYNRGIYGLKKAMKEQNKTSYYDLKLNNETSRYIYRVLAFKVLFHDIEKLKNKEDLDFINFHPLTQKIELNNNIEDIVEYADSLGINYNVLKTLNPWIISENGITIGKGESQHHKLVIEIPRSGV